MFLRFRQKFTHTNLLPNRNQQLKIGPKVALQLFTDDEGGGLLVEAHESDLSVAVGYGLVLPWLFDFNDSELSPSLIFD